MATPTTRTEFKEYCLRKLGKPVISINVSDDQIDDRIDQALQYYADYHFDGSETIYLKHQVTDEDKENGYIELEEGNEINGVVRVFQIGDPSMRSSDMFNIRYQIALNDIYNLTSLSMIPYYLTMERLALIQELLVGKQPIRFNRRMNRIYVDMDWSKIVTGEYLLFEAYQKLNPNTWPEVWGDRWLQNYATCLIKEQWGENLTKFKDIKLPSGQSFNAERILDDARTDRKKLEADAAIEISLPPADRWG